MLKFQEATAQDSAYERQSGERLVWLARFDAAQVKGDRGTQAAEASFAPSAIAKQTPVRRTLLFQ